MIRNLIKTTPQQQNSRRQQKCSVITLNINDTIFSMKRNRLTDWIVIRNYLFASPKKHTLPSTKDTNHLSQGMKKRYYNQIELRNRHGYFTI